MPFASNSSFVDVVAVTGLGERQLPREMREPQDTICDVRSFVALCGGDHTMDPRSYNVLAGSASRFAEYYGKSPRQMRRILKRGDASFIHRLPGGLLATVVDSGAHHRDRVITAAISETRRRAAAIRWDQPQALPVRWSG
jgi:hypothetical protein